MVKCRLVTEKAVSIIKTVVKYNKHDKTHAVYHDALIL